MTNWNRVLLTAGLAVATLLTALPAAAQTLDSLKGSFVVSEQGFVSNNIPMAGLGLITLDGVGGVIGIETIQNGGNTVVVKITGTYAVNSDGSGTVSLLLILPTTDDNGDNVTMTANYKFFLTKTGTELRALRSDTGTSVLSTLSRQ
jgi:hypothetical protein